jgi:hypothetical protein
LYLQRYYSQAASWSPAFKKHYEFDISDIVIVLQGFHLFCHVDRAVENQSVVRYIHLLLQHGQIILLYLLCKGLVLVTVFDFNHKDRKFTQSKA